MAVLNINRENTAAMRDYHHAAKIFTSEAGYPLVPYSGFLFHVVIYFDVNSSLVQQVPQAKELLDSRVLAVLVSESELPGISFETETLNRYNKKAIIKKRTEYEPLKLTFRDDVASKVRNMWALYNSQYNADSTRAINDWKTNTAYSETSITNWGLDSVFAESPESRRFIDKIEIHSIGNHESHVTTLVNPVITKIGFDSHDYAESKLMSVDFDIQYEGVKYTKETTDEIAAFGKNNEQFYDQNPSTLGSRNLDRTSGIVGLFNTIEDFIVRAERNLEKFRTGDTLDNIVLANDLFLDIPAIDAIAGKVKDVNSSFGSLKNTIDDSSDSRYQKLKTNIAQGANQSIPSVVFPDVESFNPEIAVESYRYTVGRESTPNGPTVEQIQNSQPITATTLGDSTQNLARNSVNIISTSKQVSSNGISVSTQPGQNEIPSAIVLSTVDPGESSISPTVPENLSESQRNFFIKAYPPLPVTDPRTKNPPYR